MYYAYNTTTGKVRFCTSNKEILDGMIQPEESFLESSDEKEPDLVNVVNGVLVDDTNAIDEQTAIKIRSERDSKLLGEVDPLVTNPIRWAELTTVKQAEWTQYRTDLLNVPDQSGFPNSITWPTKPE